MSDKSGEVAVDAVPTSPTPTSENITTPKSQSKWDWPWSKKHQSTDASLKRTVAWKIDLIFCTYVVLGYFVKYLDQTNYSNAFVSGMQVDLQLYGNERNLLNTFFGIGIIVGTVPSQMIQLRYVRPSIWIPTCELAWGILTMAMAGAKNIETLYALRFFVGLLESCSFPGYAALLGSWYGPDKLAVRQQILEQTQSVASMFSGYLQAGLYSGLNGSGGLSGWRWLYIFDGIISVPIALYGYYAIPDSPANTRARWLNTQEREYIVQQMDKIGRAQSKPLTWKLIKKVYLSKYIWVFIVPYVLIAYGASSSNYFNLWLKATGYSVTQTNLIPTAGNALTIVSALLFGALSDWTGRRISIVVFVSVIMTVSNIMLSIWYIPNTAIFVAQFLAYIGPIGQPFIIAYGNEIYQFNANLRQLLVATGNIFTYTFSAWTGVVLFPTYDAPHYKYAYQIQILFTGIGVLGAFYLKYIGDRM
ncbi:pantothenate transporter [Xylariales sp. PMI_506]|nr:pantothenate transporter [Xylariales sp. PMI_506]